MTTQAFLEAFIKKNPMPKQPLAWGKWLGCLNAKIHTHIGRHTLTISDSLTIRTQAIQQIIVTLFEQLALQTISALFATGGFARKELFSHSDVDILLIYDDKHKNHPNLSTFVAWLWDSGIHPAITLRPANDTQCTQEISIATNLLEHTFLCGKNEFAHLPLLWVKSGWTPNTFFEQKYLEKQNRHAQFGNTEYSLEPNVKASVGALRDIHFLGWIGKFYFNLPACASLADLTSVGFLTLEEYQTLTQAQQFFWQIRHHLHTLANKPYDKLDFGMQKQLAYQLGFDQGDHQKNDQDTQAAEQLMKQYYHHAMTVATLSDALGELFFDDYLEPSTQTALDNQFVAINRHGQVTIGLRQPTLFKTDPKALLQIFLAMGNYAINTISPATLRLIRTHSIHIDEQFRQNKHCQDLFVANLNQPTFLFHRLKLMKRTGILGAYLPDFAKIIGLMQYDLFHRYTVDAHTLLLIGILDRFGNDEQFGLVHTVYKDLQNKLPLIIAGLFHDIAKGHHGDHSELGAPIAWQFCQTHGLSTKDSNLVQWLVRHHLFMSITAQKKDIHDPQIINDFAQFVGDIEHLDNLYLLTVADMNATNSQLWNNWRASLLKKLYLSTHQTLSTGYGEFRAKTVIQQNQQKAMALVEFKLKHHHQLCIDTQNLWQNLPEAYFLKHDPRDIAWHTQALLTHKDNTPLILTRPHYDKSLHAHQLFIYTKNRPNLFAMTVNVLDEFGFGVYGATILTDSKDFALDSYVIVNKAVVAKSIFDDAVTQNPYHNTDELTNHLYLALLDDKAFVFDNKTKKQHSNRRLQHFSIPTQIFFDCVDKKHHLHIITKDRPSLLATLGKAFSELGLWIHSAKITTLGERAEDVFLISNPHNIPLSPNRQQQIIKTIKQILDNNQ